MLRPTARTRGGVRNLRFTPGTAVALAIAYVAWEASRTTRSPLGLFVCFAAVATVLLDLAVAVASTGRARLAATVRPTDGVVGDEATLTVSVTGTRCALRVKIGPSEALNVTPPETGHLRLGAGSRGVVSALDAEVVSFGWCGLGGHLRRTVLELERPFAVGPRPVEPARPLREIGPRSGEEMAVRAGAGDMVRGVRDYVPGDRLRQVHWRATARLGSLVVKEVEEPLAPGIVVVLHLAEWSAAGEHAAARAAWYVGDARRRGWRVILATRDVTGPVAGAVESASDLNWRLARAVVGPPALPGGMDKGTPVLVVTAEGDEWR